MSRDDSAFPVNFGSALQPVGVQLASRINCFKVWVICLCSFRRLGSFFGFNNSAENAAPRRSCEIFALSN